MYVGGLDVVSMVKNFLLISYLYTCKDGRFCMYWGPVEHETGIMFRGVDHGLLCRLF
jgi:hypothetical protein